MIEYGEIALAVPGPEQEAPALQLQFCKLRRAFAAVRRNILNSPHIGRMSYPGGVPELHREEEIVGEVR